MRNNGVITSRLSITNYEYVITVCTKCAHYIMDFVLLTLTVEFFNLDPNGADGVEKINKLLFFIPVPLVFIGGPGFLFAALLDFPFFRFFNFENTTFTFIYALMITITWFVDLYAILLMSYAIVTQRQNGSPYSMKHAN